MKIQYIDYVYWYERLLSDREKMKEAKSFWEKKLKGECPILDLPCDFPKRHGVARAVSRTSGTRHPNVDFLSYKRDRTDPGETPMENLNGNESAGYRIVIPGELMLDLKRIAKELLEKQNSVTAQQNMELQKERYATGASDSLDFRDAQVNYAQAQVRLIVARYDARISLLEIQQLIGKVEIE